MLAKINARLGRAGHRHSDSSGLPAAAHSAPCSRPCSDKTAMTAARALTTLERSVTTGNLWRAFGMQQTRMTCSPRKSAQRPAYPPDETHRVGL